MNLLKKSIILAISALAILAAPVGFARKYTSKPSHRKITRTSTASNKWRIYEGDDICAEYVIAVKGNQAWGFKSERTIGYVGGVTLTNVTPNSLTINYAGDSCPGTVGRATITPSAITIGKYRLKYNPRSDFQVYTCGDWVLMLYPSAHDNDAVIWNKRYPNIYYKLMMDDFSDNGFGIIYAVKWQYGKENMIVLDSMEGDMSIYVTKSDNTYILMTELLDIPPMTFTRVV